MVAVVASRTLATLALLVSGAAAVSAQDVPPSLRAARLSAAVVIDGRLSETDWEAADAIETFRQTDPVEGAAPSTRTRVQPPVRRRGVVRRSETDLPGNRSTPCQAPASRVGHER